MHFWLHPRAVWGEGTVHPDSTLGSHTSHRLPGRRFTSTKIHLSQTWFLAKSSCHRAAWCHEGASDPDLSLSRTVSKETAVSQDTSGYLKSSQNSLTRQESLSMCFLFYAEFHGVQLSGLLPPLGGPLTSLKPRGPPKGFLQLYCEKRDQRILTLSVLLCSSRPQPQGPGVGHILGQQSSP